MFLRFAGKAPAPLLGLMALLVPSALAVPRTAATVRAKPARVQITTRTKVQLPVTRQVRRSPNTLRVKALPIFDLNVRIPARSAAAVPAGPPAAKASKVLKKVPSIGLPGRGPKTHGGNPAYDTNLTSATFDNIEPQLMPNSTDIVWSANAGPDNFPPPAPDPTQDPNADPPLGVQAPDFLVGVNDYHLYYNGSLIQIETGTGENAGEQFEPNGNAAGVVAFSAFRGFHSDIYKPTVKMPDGSDLTPDYHGFPVRTINTTEDGIAKAQAGDPATIAKTLQPEVFGLIKITITAEDGSTTDKYMPALAPDCSPAYFPNNPRYILFVSLRGYNPTNPATHYTSLWLWDTTKSPTDVGYVVKVLSVPNKSILFPKFSPDGSYLTFTEADVKFDTDAKAMFIIPDPVFHFDADKTALKEAFKSRIFLGAFSVRDPAEGHAAAPRLNGVVQITQYKDADGNEPRDMMSFFNTINQIGFSTDRLDKDGDQLADGVETDPTKAKFDIYFYPFPYDPACSDETTPDSSAHRQTLGDKMVNLIPGDETSPLIHFDDSNELHGNAAPTSYAGNALSILTPLLLYQADDRAPDSTDASDHGWDLWSTDRAGNIVDAGNILVGLPSVTPNQTLTPEELTDLKLTHRAGLPGDYVNITVQVNPNFITYDETGAPNITVYALVKDPDNRFFVGREMTVDGVTNIRSIWSDQGAYPVKFCKPDFDTYTQKYGEAEDKPQIGALIKLKSVEAIPDPTKPVFFTGKWFTPEEVSDFLIDVIVQAAPTPNGAGLGRTTDNIGGFSTAPFIPTGRTLLVSDFGEGQKSMDNTTGVFSASGVPTESYFTFRPPAFTAGADQLPVYSTGAPNTNWATLGPRLEWQIEPTVTEDPLTGRLAIGNDGQLNFNDPLQQFSVYGNEYDFWRVQCRPPITLDDVKATDGTVTDRGVLHNYLPYTHPQPGYPNPNVTRTQRVADRCVMWIAPHTGNLNGNAGQNSLQVGTIANTTTQTELLNYINRGGRLLLAGTDIAFVLSQNDPTVRNPLLTRMKVGFQSDADYDEVSVFAMHRTTLAHAREGGQLGLNPIPYAMWEPDWPGAEPVDPTLANPLQGRLGIFRDGSMSNWHIDGITDLDEGMVGGGEPVWWYATSDLGDKKILAAVSTHTPTNETVNTSVSKTLYFAFNPDALHRGPYSGPIDGLYYLCQNMPAQIFHNTVDFFTTGAFQGQVFITNNVASPKNTLVYVVDDWNAEAAGFVRGTAITDDSGNFYIDGLDPSIYFVYAYKTGFSMQHAVRDFVDISGNGVTSDNITLVPTQPGSFTGTVYQKGTSPRQVISGVPVTITDIQGTVTQTTVTDANGQYAFTNIPTGLYIVTTPQGSYTLVVDKNDPTKNETHDYSAYTNETSPLTVKTGTNPAFDIPLTLQPVAPLPSTVQVTVTDATSGTAVPAGGAVVTLIDPATGNPAKTLDGGDNPVTTVVSDPATPEDGIAVFNVAAGRYIVQVTYGTFKPQSKTVQTNPNDVNDPSTWTKVSFEFGGILHTFTANTVLLASLPYDYSGTQTAPLSFYDVLHLDRATQPLTSAIVAFNAATQAFVFHPTYPADTAHIGRGYGLKLPADGKVTEQGNAITSNTAIIRAETGWNLIGDPYPDTVVWNGTDAASVKVALRDDPQQKQMTIEDAKSKGYILSDLWGGSSTDANGNAVYGGAYTVASPTASLVPWQAFWVKVAQPTLFYVPQPSSGSSAALKSMASLTAAHRPLLPTVDTWGLNITATGESMTDDGLALGISTRGTARLDAGLDLAKPTPISSTEYLYTAFLQGSAGAYATDVRGMASSNTWTFTVTTTLNARPVTLLWSSIGKLPSGYSVSLVDSATGQRTNMSAVNRYAFRSARNGGTRSFRVEIRRSGGTR